MNEDLEAIRVMGFWHWLWCRTGGYRAFMRFVHRFNWHHATVMGPFADGSRQHWCQWCGLRYSTPPIDYAKLLRPASKVAPSGCHCQTRCMAPVVMGRQTPCRDPGRFPVDAAADHG